MSSPDAREWYRLNMNEDGPLQIEVEIARYKAAHPDVICGRLTILGLDRHEPWLCIDGWLDPPDDQGPEPTDADIPMGFV